MTSRRQRNVHKRYKKAMDVLYDTLSSPLTIYYKTGDKIACSSCAWDPVNKESLDPNCVECNGNFYYDEILSKTVNSNISWLGANGRYTPIDLSAGILDNTDIYMGFKLKDVLIDPSDTSGDTILHQATKIDIAGHIIKPKTTPFPYAPAGLFYNAFLIGVLDKTLG